MTKDKGIFQRGDSFRVVVSYQDDAGNNKQLTGTAHSKTEARKLHAKLKTQVDHGEVVEPGRLTVTKYLEQWLEGLPSTVSPKTCALYGYISHKHIIPAIGNINLKQLKPQHIQNLYAAKLESGLSPRSTQLCHVVLHKSLDNAVKNNLMLRNPVDAVDQPRPERHEIKIMSESDIEKP